MSSKELKAAFTSEVKALEEAVNAVTEGVEIKNVDGEQIVDIPQDAYDAVQKQRAKVDQIKSLITADTEVKDLAEFAAEGGDVKERFGDSAPEVKAAADHLFDSPEFKDMVERGRDRMLDAVEIPVANLSAYGTKDVYSALGQTATSWNIGQVRQDLGYVAPLKQDQRVRDLFPVARTSANLLEYFQSTFTNNAATVGERDGSNLNFALKPKSSLDFNLVQDPIKTIAHWVPAHRNTLADKPALRSLIDDQLLYGLALEEDNQLLNGDGNNDNIKGMLNRTGIQSYDGATVSTDQPSDVIRRALTMIQLVNMAPTGVVLHPNDWEALELQKASTQGQYMLVANIAVGAQKRVWQVPVVVTPVIAEGTSLVGAFGQAAQVFDREQANLRVADQHADFFVRNAVVVLAEERLGLTSPRPEGLVRVSNLA